MSYWRWLKEALKPVSIWKTIAGDAFLEFYFGILGTCFALGFSIGFGIKVECRYFLLLLAAILFFLVAMHGRYRMSKEKW